MYQTIYTVPRHDSNEVFQVTWTPTSFDVEARTNRLKLSDPTTGMYDRGTTYEQPHDPMIASNAFHKAYDTRGIISSSYTYQKLLLATQSVVKNINIVMEDDKLKLRKLG